MHMGEARVLAHTCIWATHTRMGSPYTYGLPVCVWAAYMHMGQPICVWAEYLYGTEHL